MKRTIPTPTGDQVAFNKAVKENLESIMGQRLDKIRELPNTASTTDIINKINEIINRLQ